MELSYGAELRCNDDEASIEATIARLEGIVEGPMIIKFNQQLDLLTKLGDQRTT